MPDISIIVPIYNTPVVALERCFASLQSLSDAKWEAILVDDGSAEDVGQFCREYVAQHPRFCYFRKENGGVSSARNYGLDQATGEYVMFVDADDALLGNVITPDLLDAHPDMVVWDMQFSQRDSTQIWNAFPQPSGSISRNIFLERLIAEKDLNSPCAKLFRRAVIEEHQLRFSTDFVTGEDWLFVTEFSLCSWVFQYRNTPCYCYFWDSATGNTRLARYPDTMLDNYIAMFQKKLQIIEQEAWRPEQKETLATAAATWLVEDLFNTASELLLSKMLTACRKEKIFTAVQSVRHQLSTAPKKTRLKADVLLRFPGGLWVLAKLRAGYLAIKH